MIPQNQNIMEKLKFALFSIVVLTVLGLVGYWSFSTIQSGSQFAANQKIEQLSKENEDLKKEAEELKSELGILKQKVGENKEEQLAGEKPIVPAEKPTPTVVYKNQELINELQKLIDDNIFLKLKSRGARVGTLQKFLNIYNNTSNNVDNDYGASTEKAVSAFQKDQGLSADGEVGPNTFIKMIDWLKKQG